MPLEMFLLFWKLFLLLYSTNLISVTSLSIDLLSSFLIRICT
nr:MAG TPA: hypothetical protein [Caudoviricetes sp.]